MVEFDVKLRVYDYPELFKIAGRAYERALATAEKSVIPVELDRRPDQPDALVSVVFAVATLEAFFNEIEDENLPGLARALRAADRDREVVAAKLNAISSLFTGTPYSKGKRPFQDLKLLLNLRNAVLHLKPRDEFEFKGTLIQPGVVPLVKVENELLEKLRSKNILARIPVSPPDQGTFLAVVRTAAVAQWACNTAVDVMQAVVRMIPAGDLRDRLEFTNVDLKHVGN
jgi:hypothetical protein